MSLQNSRQISDVKIMLKQGKDGNGIESIEKTGTSLNVDTYTITLTDGTKYTFDVTNGTSIANIEKTSTVGNVDTYTITLTDNSTFTFTVTNAYGTTASDITYDNTSSGLSATDVQDAIDEVNGKVNDIDDRISAYTLGTAIDLISYTSSSNPYVFQSDGYLNLGASVSSGTYIQVKISSVLISIARYNASDSVVIYVRKGMNVYISAKGGSASLKFYPLS